MKALRKVRGATMVEYALLVVAIMIVAALAMRTLGTQVGSNATRATDELKK